MASEDLWRWAEPDGRQRAVRLEELRLAFSRGSLPTNTPVWRKGFADWLAASEVAELKGSVLAGARLTAPKGAPLPGVSVPQRGGAAAEGTEPPSPPSYVAAAKPQASRPLAPALSLSAKEASKEPIKEDGGKTVEAPAIRVTDDAETVEVRAVTPAQPQVAQSSVQPAQRPKIQPKATARLSLEDAPRAQMDSDAAVERLGPTPLAAPVANPVASSVLSPTPPAAAVNSPLTPRSPEADLTAFPVVSERPARTTLPMPSGLDGNKPDSKGRERAATLIIHAGAPPASERQDTEGAPIVVPSPNRDPAPRTITKPPPVDNGSVVATIPETPRVPRTPATVTATANTKPLAKPPFRKGPADNTGQLPVLADSFEAKAMVLGKSEQRLLDDGTGNYEAVSTSMLLPAESSGIIEDLPSAPASSAIQLDDSEAASVREPELSKLTGDDSGGYAFPAATAAVVPPIRKKEPSAPPAGLPGMRKKEPSAPPAGLPGMRKKDPSAPPMRGREPSIPPPIPRGESPSDGNVAARIGLRSLPPPEISLIPNDAISSRLIPTMPPSMPPAPPTSNPPWLAVIVAIAVVGAGAFYLGTADRLKREDGVGGSSAATSPATLATGPALSSATATVAALAPTVKAADPAIPVCKVSTSARSLGQAALVSNGVEAVASEQGLALGFAPSQREIVALRLDPASLAPTDTVRGRFPTGLRRVLPVLSERLTVVPEVEGVVEGVSMRTAVRGSTAVVGLLHNRFVLIRDGKTESVFTLPSEGISALRSAAYAPNGGPTGAAYAYRSQGAIWVGTTAPGDAPQRIPSTAKIVGSPTVATLADKVVVVWSEGDVPDALRMRVAVHKPGSAPESHALETTGGGGKKRLAPSIATVSDSHALLVWTEDGEREGASVVEVRASILGADGLLHGSTFGVSTPDMKAGQPQLALGKSGKGVATFLVQGEDNSFSVAAAAVACTK
jgi:GYF domain 2